MNNDARQQPRGIVCATDLSEASRAALDAAIEIACGGGDPLPDVHVLHVREVAERIERAQDVLDRWEERQRELREQIDGEVAHVKAARGSVRPLSFITEIRHGKAYREILRYALEVNADVVVVGTHGRTGLGHAVLGSVAERVARHASCTVVVAKSPEVRAHLAAELRRQLLGGG